MTFLQPSYLWTLLAILPLAAIYLLKVRPRRQPTNAWFLWQQVFEEKQSHALFSKLRGFLSLLLMALMIFLVSLAMSDPKTTQQDQRDIVIIIDQSASMQTRDGGEKTNTRLEIAKQKAHEVIHSLTTGQRASIAVMTNEIQFLTHLSSHTHGLHQSIDSIQPSALPLSNAAKETLKSLASENENKRENEKNEEKKTTQAPRIVLITDNSDTYPKDLLKKINLIRVDKPSKRANIGIIAADIQPVLGRNAATAMVQLYNTGNTTQKAELEFFHHPSQTIIELAEIEIKAGKNK